MAHDTKTPTHHPRAGAGTHAAFLATLLAADATVLLKVAAGLESYLGLLAATSLMVWAMLAFFAPERMPRAMLR